MQTSAPTGAHEQDLDRESRGLSRMLAYLPRGNTLDDRSWQRRHRLLKWVLLIHIPFMAALGLLLGNTPLVVGYTLIAPVVFLLLGHVLHTRRLASFAVTGGMVFCSAGLVILTEGTIEAHFHFFVIIGFIALYQDWVPFLWNVTFTFVSHGIGTIWLGDLIFAHPAGQANPWLWSGIHGVAVLFACVGMVLFWRITEDEQSEKEALGRRLVIADAEIGRKQFTSDMLVNLARRNQSMLYRQLDIINQLEDKERDPDTLADLFTLDHLATRVRRNAESLLVLAGEQPPRTWSAPVPLRDVVRAAIAETEDLDRVVFAIDDQIAVSGKSVADLTHLLAELTENAVRFSPPDTAVTIRARPDRRDDGGFLLTIEDWGVGMPPDDLAAANELLETPREVDLAVAQRLGFHVVGRLAARHEIRVALGDTPGSGVTAIVALPASLFASAPNEVAPPITVTASEARPHVGDPVRRPEHGERQMAGTGWGEPVSRSAAPGGRGSQPGTRWSPNPAPFEAPAEMQGAAGENRHELNGQSDGGWRGWWNPDSAATRPAERDPFDDGQDILSGTQAPPPGVSEAANFTPSPSPRAAPRDTDIPEPRQGVGGGNGAGSRNSNGNSNGNGSGDGNGAGSGAGTGTGTGDGSGNGTGSRRGLRRRVPQAHLAPELKHAEAEEADLSIPPDGAAASALSRYQASRQAAQAVVDEAGPGGTRS